MASTFFTAAPMGAGTGQLFKLGGDQSVTQWTAIAGGGQFLNPFYLTEVGGNVWFSRTAPGQGNQLYKLGFDCRGTKWTAVPGGLVPPYLTQVNYAILFLPVPP